MVNNIQINNQELLVLLEFEDSEYKKIIMCLNEQDERILVINGKIILDKNIIDDINKKYELEELEEQKNVIY